MLVMGISLARAESSGGIMVVRGRLMRNETWPSPSAEARDGKMA